MRATIASLLSVAASAVSAQSLQCAQGVHIIVARGSNEDEGTGSMGEIADRIVDEIRGSEVDGLDYPATIMDPAYMESAKDGAEEMREVVRQYVEDCPNTKLVIMGYSQGAQVATNALCGGGGSGFGNEDALPQDLVEDHVSAIVLFGDPSHVANATYNRGTADNDGLFPRDDIDDCEDLSDRLVSYCDSGDTYCDIGGDRDEDVHGDYVENYGDEVVEYVLERYESDAGDSSNSTTSSASGTATPSPTSSGTATLTETDTATQTATTTGEPTGTETGDATETGEEGEATETGDAGDAAAGLVVPGLGLVGLASLAVLGLI